MKIRHYIGIMLLFIVAFQSCKKDETRAILASGESIKPATLSLDKTNVTLSKDNAKDTVLHLNMIQPDFGFQAAVTNVLQFALKGDNFKTVKEVVIPNGRTSLGFTGKATLTGRDSPHQNAISIYRFLIHSSKLFPSHAD